MSVASTRRNVVRALGVFFAALTSVVTKQQKDSQESFLYAETLKYFYLLFAPDSALDFDAVTFNTEAHPLRKTWKD